MLSVTDRHVLSSREKKVWNSGNGPIRKLPRVWGLEVQLCPRASQCCQCQQALLPSTSLQQGLRCTGQSYPNVPGVQPQCTVPQSCSLMRWPCSSKSSASAKQSCLRREWWESPDRVLCPQQYYLEHGDCEGLQQAGGRADMCNASAQPG